VYFTNTGTRAANYEDGAVMRVAKMGGAATTIASGQWVPAGIAVDDRNVYWVDSGLADGVGTVMMAAKGGGAPVVLASGQDSPGAIVVDASCVYWTNVGTSAKNDADGAVMMVAKK
jgi:hypothetical protein